MFWDPLQTISKTLQKITNLAIWEKLEKSSQNLEQNFGISKNQSLLNFHHGKNSPRHFLFANFWDALDMVLKTLKETLVHAFQKNLQELVKI